MLTKNKKIKVKRTKTKKIKNRRKKIKKTKKLRLIEDQVIIAVLIKGVLFWAVTSQVKLVMRGMTSSVLVIIVMIIIRVSPC